MNTTAIDLSYPIGKYVIQDYSESLKEEWIADIQFLPHRLEAAIQNLDEQQLQTPYRDGGWTVHQLVHHVADSHMNGYTRTKLGYTEETPIIKPYNEKAWAELNDVKNLPINISLTILYAVHQRWHEFLKSIEGEYWERTVIHPEHGKQFTLWQLLGMYSWHGRHHVAHITALRERKGW